MDIAFIMVLVLYIRTVSAKFTCLGTCYSGRLFPKPEHIVHGKHLQGYSYRNITTDDAKKCYSSCLNECRCKACQMNDARCELLDEDNTTKAGNFVDGPGYVYYDLQQEFYKGKSHMVEPAGVCYNGCCSSQPCMNGGSCIEHCKTPKQKFTCKCPSLVYYGGVCQFKHKTSCLDILKSAPPGIDPKRGQYTILNTASKKLKTLYCDFEGGKTAWTLIESFALALNSVYRTISFFERNARNRNAPNWIDYHLGYATRIYVHSKANVFRATCDFPNRGGKLTPDYIFGYLSDYDIIKDQVDMKGKCLKFAHINIKGYDFFNKTARVWHAAGVYHFHLDTVNKAYCEIVVPKTLSIQDFFGWYSPHPPITKCTERIDSTTQFWLGEEM